MADLTDIFKKMGIEVTDADENKYLRINFDTQEVKNKLKRNAGREKKKLESQISVAEVRERMQKGETGEQIAKEIGISRASLFRKMKDAKQHGQEYIK